MSLSALLGSHSHNWCSRLSITKFKRYGYGMEAFCLVIWCNYAHRYYSPPWQQAKLVGLLVSFTYCYYWDVWAAEALYTKSQRPQSVCHNYDSSSARCHSRSIWFENSLTGHNYDSSSNRSCGRWESSRIKSSVNGIEPSSNHSCDRRFEAFATSYRALRRPKRLSNNSK